MIALVLAGCTQHPDAQHPDGTVDLDPVKLLTRYSLDTRGVRPTDDEIGRVQADPNALDDVLGDYFADQRFSKRVGDLFSEVYLTRTENYQVSFAGFDTTGLTTPQMLESVGDEPLQMLGYIAQNDLPVTDLVTADWTMANEVDARFWPTDYPEGGTGWKKVHYTDGRPAAGVLSSNSMWWRYQTTDSNANRGRANTVSRILLCADYLTRPIEFDRNVNLLDSDAITDALRNNPGCEACHISLDPLAAYFFGFSYQQTTGAEISNYHEARERNWETSLGVPPSYYGQPGDNLADLGHQIASDNRFPQCIAQHVTELLLRRPTTIDDEDELTAHRDALIDGGMRLGPLFDSVMHSEEYQAATDGDGPQSVPLKMVTPDLLESEITDLTGFTWQSSDGYDLIESDQQGFLDLAGGADGVYAVKNSTGPNSTLLLVQERLAEAASSFVVDNDRADPTRAKLFTEVAFTETPDTGHDAMVRQIQKLHLKLFGNTVDADGPEVEANLGLWSDLYAVDHDVPTAWKGLLSALFRDPDFLFY